MAEDIGVDGSSPFTYYDEDLPVMVAGWFIWEISRKGKDKYVSWKLFVFTLSLCSFLSPDTFGIEPVRIGEEAVIPDNPRSHYSRYVNWRPADREVVRLNPPRMSWPYSPDWPPLAPKDALHQFTLQISDNPKFSRPVVDVQCPFNFYNTIPALDSSKMWYWRVGYDIGTAGAIWSSVRSFSIAEDATVWDRAALAEPVLSDTGHPRILFTNANLDHIRALAETDPGSRAALQYMQNKADEIVESPWWKDFPETDMDTRFGKRFYLMTHDLALVCFVWRMTGDDRYAGVKERAVAFASYPPGGYSSPERPGQWGNEDATLNNEYLALLFDWLYDDLNEEERAIMIASLEWRVDLIMNGFAWRIFRSRGPWVELTFLSPSEEIDDRGFPLEQSTEWQPFEFEVEILPGTTEVVIELFNYEGKGRVWWDSLRVVTGSGSPNLVRNADFSKSEDGILEGWNPETASGAPEFRYIPNGGRNNTGTVMITCPDYSSRGSWRQAVTVSEGESLLVSGWYRSNLDMRDAPVQAESLAGLAASHHFEASMDTAVCGLALYGHSEIGKKWFELMLNYLIGVTCSHGFDEAWNEGAGYGASKSKWLANASIYFDTTLPDANLGRNPFYPRMGEFFSRILPVGMPHHVWGNQRTAWKNHLSHFRKYAYLTGKGQFLLNWRENGGEDFSDFRPWIEYVLPAYYEEPAPVPETDPVGLFPVDGWVMAATGPPSLRSTYEEGAGVAFQCRPRAAFSHSFNSDSSFQLHAYGAMLNHGGSGSSNGDPYVHHSMSHNLVLIDGLGQAQPDKGQIFPAYGKIVGFARGDDYVYFAGDSTLCYPREKGTAFRRWAKWADEYDKRALPYLKRVLRHILFVRGKYFVIYDDLECSQPATYTWLYHILPQEPFSFDEENVAFDYEVKNVKVHMRHIARHGELQVDDRQGLDGRVNPFTGEDYRKQRRGRVVCGHNLWISNKEKAKKWNFLTVVYPTPPGGEIPSIAHLDDHSVRVGEDVITFYPESDAAAQAKLVIDVAAFR